MTPEIGFFNPIKRLKHTIKNKRITRTLAKREKAILQNIKINEGVNATTTENITKNADSIARYARRHGVHLEFSPSEGDLFTKTKMSIRKNEFESHIFFRNNDKIARYPVINEYELAEIPVDKIQTEQNGVISLKNSIKTALENYKNNPKSAKFTREIANFFVS